jgi:hypothetical protein
VRKPVPFDTTHHAAREYADALPAGIAECTQFIALFSRSGETIDDERFVAENHRFMLVVADAGRFADLLAEAVATLDAMTVRVSADLDSFRGLTATERFIGRFSRQRMWRRHSARVRAAPVVARLRDLMDKSNLLAGTIADYRRFIAAEHKTAEAALVDIVERRRRLVDEIDIARIRIKELNARALTTQGRIGVYGSKFEWERMEQDRQALKAQADGVSTKEHEMRDESQRRERFIGMFQTLVDMLNTQIGHCNTLMRKLMIDTEERLLIYQAQVDTDIPGSKVQISSELFPEIADAIVLFERDMLLPQEIEHRKRTADAQFGKRFAAFAHEPSDTPHGPLIDTTRIASRLRFRMPRL